MTSGRTADSVQDPFLAMKGSSATLTTAIHTTIATKVRNARPRTSQELQGGSSTSAAMTAAGGDTNGCGGSCSVSGLFGELKVSPLSGTPAISVAIEIVG